VALLEKRRYLNNRSGDFPQVILIVPSHVPNSGVKTKEEPSKEMAHLLVEWISVHHRLNIELDLQSLFGLHVHNTTAVLIG
jgi:hypothetical protein